MNGSGRIGLGGWLGAAVLAAAAAAVWGCGVGRMLHEAHDVDKTGVSGQLVLHGATLGERTIDPRICQSGQRRYFLGVDAMDEAQGVTVRVVSDPIQDTLVRVLMAPERGVVFRPAICSVLHASVVPTGWRVNGVDDFSGELTLDCHTDKGDGVSGHIQFTHCH